MPIPLPWPLPTLYAPTTLDPAAWQEDTLLLNPAQRVAYGHRDEMGTPAFDSALQDYPTPCEYWGFDSPRVSAGPGLLGRGLQLQVDLEFRGEIIDACRGGVADGPRLWTWRWNSPL